MNFRNLTRFAAQCFQSLDAHGQRHHTIVTRVAYRLTPDGQHHARLALIEDLPPPLAMLDAYEGEPNASSVRAESDLSPFKPRCDVLVRAQAHAPRGLPLPCFATRLELRASALPPKVAAPEIQEQHWEDDDIWQDLPSWRAESRPILKAQVRPARHAEPSLPQAEVLIDKTLIATGERVFQKNPWHWPAQIFSMGLAPTTLWTLSEPKPFVSLPLGYEYAYGGDCRIDPDDPAAERVKQSVRLSEAQRAAHPAALAPEGVAPVAHAIEPRNPLGRGFAPKWYVQARRAGAIPAPRIESADQPISAAAFSARMLGVEGNAEIPIAGFGPLGRSWLPRLKHAGTYDAAWLAQQHPLPPRDFKDAYWNCAPSDQHIEFPNLRRGRQHTFKLTNLLPAGHPATQRDRQGNTVLEFVLPRQRPVLLTRWNGGMLLPYSLNLDTIHIDLIEEQVHLVWRLRLPANAPIRVAELRFNADPDAPLLPSTPPPSQAQRPTPRREASHV